MPPHPHRRYTAKGVRLRLGDHAFHIRNGDRGNRDFRVEIPLGPRFKTPQWERTVLINIVVISINSAIAGVRVCLVLHHPSNWTEAYAAADPLLQK